MPGLPCTSHPAPVPLPASYLNIPARDIPVKLSVKGYASSTYGFVLEISNFELSNISKIQVFHYEQTDQEPTFTLWKKVSEIHEITNNPYKVSCQELNRCRRHHFTVRAMNHNNIYGPFSEPVCY